MARGNSLRLMIGLSGTLASIALLWSNAPPPF
jgi:hypothetical protein